MKTQETEHSNNVKTLEEKINAIKKYDGVFLTYEALCTSGANLSN